MYPIRFHSFINDFNIALEQSKRTSYGDSVSKAL